MKHKFLYIFCLLILLCAVLSGCDGGETPHEHTALSWQTAEAPTCTQEGLAVGSCSVCREAMETALPMIPHILTETVVPPTCDTVGYTRYTCECGYTYDGEFVSPTGHELTPTITPPTCTEAGFTRYTCACGYTYDGDFVSPTGHDPAQTVTPPACTEEGFTRYICACGYTYDGEFVSPTGHDPAQTVTPPTCTEEGFTRYTCACGYTYDGDFVSPTGHEMTQTVTLPTCTEEGFTHYACACGYEYDGDPVPPAGHELTQTVTSPTCAEAGYIHYACGVCNYERDSDPIPPLNHANTVDTVFYPTILRDGYTLHTCTDCGQSYEDSFVRYGDIFEGAYTDNTNVLMQGIDTSKWNHEYGASLEDIKPLDWEALKTSGVDFVILKVGSTKGIDPAFEMDYQDAKAAGLQVGAYFYTYATTVEEALADAEMLLSWLEGKQFEFPIYLDMEDPTLLELDGALLTEMCKTFVIRMQEAGYYAALYTNTEWLYNLLDTEWVKENLDVWYARYTTALPEDKEGFTLEDDGFVWKDGTTSKPGETDKRFGIWQYTSDGSIQGFRYNFDLNYAFKDYASIMTRWGLNGFSPEIVMPETI